MATVKGMYSPQKPCCVLLIIAIMMITEQQALYGFVTVLLGCWVLILLTFGCTVCNTVQL